jgi:hypothetical protein
MVTAMQADHCVWWEPLSGQDMQLAWRRRPMRNHKELTTSLFRKSLCVRMRISSTNNNPVLAKRERSLDYWCRKAVVGQRRVRVNSRRPRMPQCSHAERLVSGPASDEMPAKSIRLGSWGAVTGPGELQLIFRQ